MLLSTILVISFGFASVSSFGFAIPFSRPGTFLKAVNKLDGTTIEGDLSPTSNNVFVKVKEITSVTKGGFIIPDSAKERPNEGTVVSAGAGKVHPDTGELLQMSAEPGTNVLYGKYDGSELSYNDANIQMIKDDDILLTYSGPEATLASVKCVKDSVLIKLPREDIKQSGLILTPKKADNKYTRTAAKEFALIGNMLVHPPINMTRSYNEPSKWLQGLPEDKAAMLNIIDVPVLNSKDVTSVKLLRLPLPWATFHHEKQAYALAKETVLVSDSPMVTTDEKPVLDELLRGKSVALVGHQGIGKSSQLNILLHGIFAELADSTKPLQHVFQRLDTDLYHYFMKDGEVECCVEEGAGASLSSLYEFFKRFQDSKSVADKLLRRKDTVLILELGEYEIDPQFTRIPTLVALSARKADDTLKTIDKSGNLKYVTRGPPSREELQVLATAYYLSSPAEFIEQLGLPSGATLEEAHKEVRRRTDCIGPLPRQVLGEKSVYQKWVNGRDHASSVDQFLNIKEIISAFDLPSTSKYFLAPLAEGGFTILGEKSKELMLQHAKKRHIGLIEQINVAWQLQEKVVLEYFVLDKARRSGGKELPFAWRHENWEFYHNPPSGKKLSAIYRVDATLRQQLCDNATKHTRIAMFEDSMLHISATTLDPECVYLSKKHNMPLGEYFTVSENLTTRGIEATFYSLSTLDPHRHSTKLATLQRWKDSLGLQSIKVLFFTDWSKKSTGAFRVEGWGTDADVSEELFGKGKTDCFRSYLVRCGVYVDMSRNQMLEGGSSKRLGSSDSTDRSDSCDSNRSADKILSLQALLDRCRLRAQQSDASPESCLQLIITECSKAVLYQIARAEKLTVKSTDRKPKIACVVLAEALERLKDGVVSEVHARVAKNSKANKDEKDKKE